MRLARDDVDGLGALVPGLGVIADACALGQRLVAVTADAAVMDEEVLAGLVGRDEPEPLVIAEPLHCSCSHVMYLYGVCALRTRRCCKATTAGAEHCDAEREVRPDAVTVARALGRRVVACAFRRGRCRWPSGRRRDRGRTSAQAASRAGCARAWRYGDRSPAPSCERARPISPRQARSRRPRSGRSAPR